jgi:hypothetical protein
MPRLSLVSAYKTHNARDRSAERTSAASTIEYMLCVLRLLARMLVSSETIKVQSKAFL